VVKTFGQTKQTEVNKRVTGMPITSQNSTAMSGRNWALLIALSVLWGGSFIFIGIAVTELPALLIVLVRVGLAAALLIPTHYVVLGKLPTEKRVWIGASGMALLNNVIPFSLIVYGQHFITAGLASVINATTPLFGAIVMASAGAESLTGRKVAGLLLGLGGVCVLKGVGPLDFGQQNLGIICVLLASMSYGVSSFWAKRRLVGIPPLTSATCQLVCSTLAMTVLANLFSTPTYLLTTSLTTWMALAGLALFSTAIAYLIFFRIIASAGASAVLLVTMLIPVSAIIMGVVVLNETLLVREIVGATIIGLGLLVIDGRLFAKLRKN
jgi:drug/metabolite transporter (DMT)-like permease